VKNAFSSVYLPPQIDTSSPLTPAPSPVLSQAANERHSSSTEAKVSKRAVEEDPVPVPPATGVPSPLPSASAQPAQKKKRITPTATLPSLPSAPSSDDKDSIVDLTSGDSNPEAVNAPSAEEPAVQTKKIKKRITPTAGPLPPQPATPSL
jgi:hypothetical protein